MMTRAAQTHQAGHMRPAGRVFETPDLNEVMHHQVRLNHSFLRQYLFYSIGYKS